MKEWEHNPGSADAVARGCTCPVMDNAHGKGLAGDGKAYWITMGCPLHGGGKPAEPRHA